MAFNIALSGLNAASKDLEVTANNIANTGTTGFKGSRAQFAELFSAAGPNLSSSQVGSGVRDGVIVGAKTFVGVTSTSGG